MVCIIYVSRFWSVGMLMTVCGFYGVVELCNNNLHGPTVKQILILGLSSSQVSIIFRRSTPPFLGRAPSPHHHQSSVACRWRRRGTFEWFNHSHPGAAVLPPFLLSQGQFAQKLVALEVEALTTVVVVVAELAHQLYRPKGLCDRHHDRG